MRPEGRTKSRSKLYNAIIGAKELVGASGVSANWTVVFPNLAAVGDTVTIGPYVWEYVADGSESVALATAGTAADPHLLSIGGTPTATTAAAALAVSLLAETATSGKWGYLHPVDATGVDATTDTLTVNFWPGTFANAATYITVTATGTDPTVANVSDGTQAKTLSVAHAWNIIDTTGNGSNKEYYHLSDGQVIGESARVMVKTFASNATPTIIGHLTDGSTASVEALFITAEPGMYVSFVWTGATWQLTEEGFGTGLTFDAAA
jgi:hypothetical protein